VSQLPGLLDQAGLAREHEPCMVCQCEAIPPAYTELIGAQLLAHINQEVTV
jgi:hypothetical protein